MQIIEFNFPNVVMLLFLDTHLGKNTDYEQRLVDLFIAHCSGSLYFNPEYFNNFTTL